MADATNLSRAKAAWGTGVPDWILVLAEECDVRGSQKHAAARMDYSSSVINQVLSNTYRGDLRAVESAVRGAFLGAVVQCPVLGEIGKDRCLTEQKTPLHGANPQRVQLYRACRGGCAHSRLTATRAGAMEGGDAE